MEKETFRKSTSQKLQDLRNQIRTGTLLRTRVPERLNRSKGARFTAKTLLQFVDRAALIYGICSADEVLRRECKVVLVVGEENVGKSSLLKCILRSCGEDRLAETIKVGETTHTRNMEVYPCALKLSGRNDGELLLVDSPGTSTPDNRNEDSFAWQCMERVPDLCLVMLEFKGDVQRGSAELMKDIDGRKVCSTQNQVLVVNRVDSRLHGNPNAQVWRDLNLNKMEEMKSEFAKNSGIQKETVLMTVLNDENLFAEELPLLRKRGVLLQKEATEAILSIFRDLFTKQMINDQK